MENAFAWLNAIFQYFGQFVPQFFLVKWTERGVRYRRGNFPKEILPGLHWFWPLTTHVEKAEIVWRWDEFNATTLTTLDGKPLSIGYTMSWRIADIVKAHTETDANFQTLGEMAELPLAQIVHTKTYDQLRAMLSLPLGKRNSLDGLLTRRVRREVKRFGVEVGYCRVGFDSPTRVIKLLQEEK
jgi:regulator of protease activity HflC (stomatin/prohibitin superfamily)